MRARRRKHTLNQLKTLEAVDAIGGDINYAELVERSGLTQRQVQDCIGALNKRGDLVTRRPATKQQQQMVGWDMYTINYDVVQFIDGEPCTKSGTSIGISSYRDALIQINESGETDGGLWSDARLKLMERKGLIVQQPDPVEPVVVGELVEDPDDVVYYSLKITKRDVLQGVEAAKEGLQRDLLERRYTSICQVLATMSMHKLVPESESYLTLRLPYEKLLELEDQWCEWCVKESMSDYWKYQVSGRLYVEEYPHEMNSYLHAVHGFGRAPRFERIHARDMMRGYREDIERIWFEIPEVSAAADEMEHILRSNRIMLKGYFLEGAERGKWSSNRALEMYNACLAVEQQQQQSVTGE